jgi:hypothetical protein
MKRLCTGVVVVGLLAVAACNKNGNDNKNQPQGGNPAQGGTFELENPKAITIKQGTEKEYTFTIDRKPNFTQNVTLTFKGPEGIGFDPKEVKLPPNEGNKGGKVSGSTKITVTKMAPVGDQQITVIATPEHGDKIEKALPIKIEKP